MTHLPITSNTGSLPDLTVVHFQSPLTTPIDAEEAYGCSQGNLSPTSAHMQGMCPQPGSPTQQSPNQRRRPGGHPSPLVLSGGPQSPQMRMPHSPPGSVSIVLFSVCNNIVMVLLRVSINIVIVLFSVCNNIVMVLFSVSNNIVMVLFIRDSVVVSSRCSHVQH